MSWIFLYWDEPKFSKDEPKDSKSNTIIRDREDKSKRVSTGNKDRGKQKDGNSDKPTKQG